MKRTKTKLVSSIVTLLVCFAMLVGSTFAWFTDSASTGVNKIQAGNLDVVLSYKKNKQASDFVEVSEDELMFDDVSLWEPGAYAYETFEVKNAGNLALHYQMNLGSHNFNWIEGDGIDGYTIGTDKSLKDVLKVAVTDTFDGTRESASSLSYSSSLDDFIYSGSLEPSEIKQFTVVVCWVPNILNDNDYNLSNGKLATPFTSTDAILTNRTDALYHETSVELNATQYTFESDSFGNDYDIDAYLADAQTKAVLVTNAETLNKALTNGSYVKLANDITDETLEINSNVASYLDLNGKELKVRSININDVRDGAKISLVNTANIPASVIALSGDVEILAPNGDVNLSSVTFYKDRNHEYVIDATTSSLHITKGDVAFKNLDDNNGTENASLADVTIPVNTNLVVQESATFQATKVTLVAPVEEAKDQTPVFSGKIDSSSQTPIRVDTELSEIKVITENSDKFVTDEDSDIKIGNWSAEIGSDKYFDLQEAFDNVDDGETIKLVNNITSDGIQKSFEGSNAILDFSGKTLKGAIESGSILNGDPNSNLTLMDSLVAEDKYSIDGKIFMHDGGGYTQIAAITAWKPTVTIQSGNYTHDNAVILCQLQTSDPDIDGVVINGGKFVGQGAASVIANIFGNVTINGGSFYAYDEGDNSGECIYVNYGNSRISSTTIVNNGNFNATKRIVFVKANNNYVQKVVINGGNFELAEGGKIIEASDGKTSNYLTIYGGTFNVDPSDYVPDGYSAVKTGDNTWVVRKNTVLDQYSFSDATEELAFCADCYNNPGTDHSSHNGYLNIVNGVAEVKRTGAWMAFKDLEWVNKSYKLEYDVDLSDLAEGCFVAFDSGETASWQDLHLGFKKTSDGIIAYNTLFTNQLNDPKKLGTIGNNVHVSYIYSYINNSNALNIKMLITDGINKYTVEKTVNNFNSSADLCWDVYTAEGQSEIYAKLDNFTFSSVAK